MSMSTTTMRSPSCPCPPPHHHHHRRTTPALELLDEYWFFSNTLAGSSNTNNKPPSCGSPSSSSSSSKDRHGTTTSPRFASSRGRRLLRTPSLPPPRPRVDDDDDLRRGSGDRQQQQPVQDDDDDLNWSSIYEGVLRTRIAEGGSGGAPPALRRAPSMPVPSVKPGPAPSSTSSSRMPRSSTSGRSNSIKWRSSGDLEPISSSTRRPPALVRVQSAAEMKDQLRMWAQAVACNVRRQDS
nr:unnamed protein product [Digitaria exilis]